MEKETTKEEEIDGIYLGRFSPFHLGHKRVVDEMIKKCTIHNSIIIIGSSNIHAPTSMRNFFTYTERRYLIKKIFPLMRIIGLPDYSDEEMWFLALGDLLDALNINQHKAVYFGGSQQDVDFFIRKKRRVHIVNRFDSELDISGSKIRDYLIQKKSIGGLVDHRIINDIEEMFNNRWPHIMNF